LRHYSIGLDFTTDNCVGILGGLSAGSGKLLVEDAPDLKSYMKNKKKSLVDDEDVGLVDELTGDAPEVISFKSKISPQAKKAGKAAPAPYEDSEEEGKLFACSVIAISGIY
jgi:hypothetical protein